MVQRVRFGAIVGLALLTALVAPASGRADDFVDRVNAPLESIRESKRSDLLLLPTLIALEEAPSAVRSVLEAALITADSQAWDVVREWAAGETQQAVIEALTQITQEDDFRKAMVFAQPYGIEGVAGNVEIITAGLYAELGDPPTLAGAKLGYMPSLRTAEILAHINATRLLEDGDTKGALTHLNDWLFLARQMADRAFVQEVAWAMESMRFTLERMRDVAYQDSLQSQPGLDPNWIAEALLRLETGASGFLGIDRLTLPMGDVIAAEQLLARVIDQGGDVDDDRFGPAMASLVAGERPLRLFSEAAYWNRVGSSHAGWYEAMDKVRQVGEDWTRRWNLNRFDPILATSSDYAGTVKDTDKFAIIAHVAQGVEDLFDLRQLIETELAGTTSAMAVYGYALEFKSQPLRLTSVRPRFIKTLPLDPFNQMPSQILQFFVPVRDTPKGPRGELIDWVVEAHPGNGYLPFRVPFRDQNTSIVYSVGRDNRKGRCQYAVQADPAAAEGDYILWPPMLSLLRKHLEDTGKAP